MSTDPSHRALDSGLSDVERDTLSYYETRGARWGAERDDPGFWAPELQTLRSLRPHGRVLDAGCGHGRDALMLTQAGYQVTGVDLSARQVAAARERCPQAEFAHASMCDLPFADGSFDVVWAAASLLHLPADRVGVAMSELRRVLCDDGVMFAAVKAGEGEEMLDGRYFAYYTPVKLAALLAAHDLSAMMLGQRPGAGVTWVCAFARPAGA